MSCQKLKQLDFTYLFSGKESTYNEKDLDSIPGLGRCLGEGKGYSLQCSGLENSMGCIVCGVVKSWTQQNDFHFHFYIYLRVQEVFYPFEMKFSV